jgi:soluble lytic murein transglycosylase
MRLRPLGRTELRAFERDHSDYPAATEPLLTAYQAVDGYRDAIRLAHARGFTDPNIFFPLAFWPQVERQTRGTNLDPLFVLALMRQESMFDPAARSPADARGLMQLLPSTAEGVAQRTGQPSPEGKLYDADTNITLGVAHLHELMAAYGGDPIRTMAAYNGGAAAVAKWDQRFGGLPPDEFVESITYRETREYVKRVLGNYRRYQQEYAR